MDEHHFIMTPGPTQISEEVRAALARPMTNPDLDMDFFEFYKELCVKTKKLFNTSNDAVILCGEGILGLEAACASIIEPGDRVLCIDNGIFGNGFGDFARMYGAEVVYFKGDYRNPVNINDLKAFLEKENNFKAATLVHCETPSGFINPVNEICPLLKKYGILTIVDAVSSVGGETVMTDEWKIDILLCGSQKCISAPPGLSLVSISEDAWMAIDNRKKPVAGFYTNLNIFRNWYEKKEFPYTQPASDLQALNTAIDRLLAQDQPVQRHKRIAEAVRKAVAAGGLELYPKSGFANTVTSIVIPEGITFDRIFNDMVQKHNIMIAGGFSVLAGKVFRIGHMGENCYEDKLFMTMKALDSVLRENGVKLKAELHKVFVEGLS